MATVPDFEHLLELLERFEDLAAAREAFEEAEREGTLSWDEVKAELGL